MINFDMHLDFDTIHSVELNIILQETDEFVSYGELYKKVHKRKYGKHVSNKEKKIVFSIHVLKIQFVPAEEQIR